MALVIGAPRKLLKGVMTDSSKSAGLNGTGVDHAHQVHPRRRVVAGRSSSDLLHQTRSAIELQDRWDQVVVAGPVLREVRVWDWTDLDLRRLSVPSRCVEHGISQT